MEPDAHDEFLRFVDEMGRRAQTGQPLVQAWQRGTNGEQQTAGGLVQLHHNQQDHKWYLQRQIGTGWANFGQKAYDSEAEAKADAEQAVRREASV